MKTIFLAVLLCGIVSGQTQPRLSTQSQTPDFRKFAMTFPLSVGASLPATCAVGQLYFLTTATAGQNIYVCASTNVWSAVSSAATGSVTQVLNPTFTSPLSFLSATTTNQNTTPQTTFSATAGQPSHEMVGTCGTATSVSLCSLVAGDLPQIPLTNLLPEASNTLVGNATASSASPTAIAVPSCPGANQALNWTSGTGFGCNTISSTGGTPGGSSTSVQINNAGSFGGVVLGDGQLLFGQTSANPAAHSLSQDCTVTDAGVITCTKTNNVPFANSATTDTTNAANISTGTISVARLPAAFLSDPGANGMVYRSALNTTRVATQGTDFQGGFALSAPFYGNGTTTGIAGAVTACGTTISCSVIAPPSYGTTEVVPNFSIDPNNHNNNGQSTMSKNILLLDQRYADRQFSNGLSGYCEGLECSVHTWQHNWYLPPNGGTLSSLQSMGYYIANAYAGGSNLQNNSVNGGVGYYNKSTWNNTSLQLFAPTSGQVIGLGVTVVHPGNGDAIGSVAVVQSGGGLSATADEGAQNGNSRVLQNPAPFQATSSITSTGATSLTYTQSTAWTNNLGAVGLNAQLPGEGRTFVDLTTGGYSTGTISAITSSGTSLTVLTGTGTSWPVSTAYGTTTSEVSAPGSATVSLSFTAGNISNITTSTLVCLGDGVAFEKVIPSAVGSGFTATFRKPHLSGSTFGVGGVCGYYMSLDADNITSTNFPSSLTVSGNQNIASTLPLRWYWPLVYSTSATSASVWISSGGAYQSLIGVTRWSNVSGQNTYHFYQGAETVSVAANNGYSQTAATVEPNAVPWTNGDTIEQGLYPAVHYSNGNIITQFFTPCFANQACGTGYTFNGILQGNDTLLSLNLNTNTAFYSGGSANGTYTAPRGIAINSPTKDGISFATAPSDVWFQSGCQLELTACGNTYAGLFQLGGATGAHHMWTDETTGGYRFGIYGDTMDLDITYSTVLGGGYFGPSSSAKVSYLGAPGAAFYGNYLLGGTSALHNPGTNEYFFYVNTSGTPALHMVNSSGTDTAVGSGGGGGMVYPGAGIPLSTGSAWGTSYSAQGTDTKLLTAGTVSGTGSTLCTDGSGGATTSGCSGGGGGTNATQFQGVAISNATPTNNQAFVYNSGATQYNLATLSSLQNGLGVSVTGTGTVQPNIAVGYRNVAGTTDAWANTDCGGLVTYSSASSTSVQLSQAGLAGNFVAGCPVKVRVAGAGTVTLTPTTGTIGGSGSLALTSGQSAEIVSDGTNYQIAAIANTTGSGGGSGVSTFNTRAGAVTLTLADISALGTISNSTTGNAATATSLSSSPTQCSGTNVVSTGIASNGNANCLTISTGGGSYTLPTATTSVLGGIKPDGSSIVVNPSTGVASVAGSAGAAIGQATVYQYGAVGNGQYRVDGDCNNGDNHFTGSGFVSGDVGKDFQAIGCGASNATWHGTITGVTSSTVITLSTTAACGSGCPYPVTYAWGTPDHAAFQNCVDTIGASGGGVCTVPGPSSCPSGSICGFYLGMNSTGDGAPATAHTPHSVAIRYNNTSLVGVGGQVPLFANGWWATYNNSTFYGGTTATIRGNAINIGDQDGPLGTNGLYLSNVRVAGFQVFGMTNGDTYNNAFDPTSAPLTTTGDGWDTTHHCIYVQGAPSTDLIEIDHNTCSNFKGETVLSGGGSNRVFIHDNELSGTNGDCLSYSANNFRIQNNFFHDCFTNGIENGIFSGANGTGYIMVGHVYSNNRFRDIQGQGIALPGVSTTPNEGTIEIDSNNFERIGVGSHTTGVQAAVYVIQQINTCPGPSNCAAPANVFVRHNTCRDCNSFMVWEGSGHGEISDNTAFADNYAVANFMPFNNPFTDVLIENNKVYTTAYAQSHNLSFGQVYDFQPGYASGNFNWTQLRIQHNDINLKGTSYGNCYRFITSTGAGYSLITGNYPIFKDEACLYGAYPGTDQGQWNLATSATIIPVGSEIHIYNASASTASISTSKVEDGDTIKLVNIGTTAITFSSSDSNLDLSASFSLTANQSAIFRYNALETKWVHVSQ